MAITATPKARIIDVWAGIGVNSTSARGALADPSIDPGSVNATDNERTATDVAPTTFDVARQTLVVRDGDRQRLVVGSEQRQMS
jgi:hypothetical protein